MDGGFISGYEVRGRGEANLNISHLLFADDTIVFYAGLKISNI